MALGDLDGDGDLDALVANCCSQAETVWRNDGTGSFSAHPTTPSFGAGDSYGVALGDLDGDGDLDAVVANFIGEAETVWRNNGTGSFSAHPTSPPSAPATATAWRWATWTATATSMPSSPPVVVARPRRCGSTATSRAWA